MQLYSVVAMCFCRFCWKIIKIAVLLKGPWRLGDIWKFEFFIGLSEKAENSRVCGLW